MNIHRSNHRSNLRHAAVVIAYVEHVLMYIEDGDLPAAAVSLPFRDVTSELTDCKHNK